MAYRYRIAPAAGLAVVCFTGTVTGPDVIVALRQVYEDPGFRPAYDVIWDATEIKKLILAPGELERMAALQDAYRSYQDRGRDLIVAVREIDYVVARLYVHLSRGLHQRLVLCHAFDEALHRLGLAALPAELVETEG